MVSGTCSVLIETYWNVNIKAVIEKNVEAFVLIETYWNVNFSPNRVFLFRDPGLNRNILECKYRLF